MAAARLKGQFVVVQDVDLLLRVESLDVSGLTVPGHLMTAILGGADHPIISLRRLPVPVVIDRVTTTPGRVVVTARVGRMP
jgi:hypothetical protein